MHLKHLDIHGMKDSDRSVELGKLNLVVGPVGAGKSTTLDAIRFLALGYVPSIGKKESATAQLMRDGEIVVNATLDDGRIVTRKLTREGVKLTGNAVCSWLPPKAGATEAGEVIRGFFGASDIEAAENLDLRNLLSASAAERAQKIEALLDASGMSIDDVITRACALAALRLADIHESKHPDTPGAAKVLADSVAALITGPRRAVLPAVNNTIAEWVRSGGIANALERAKAAKAEAASDCKQKVAARGEIESRQAALVRPSATIADLQKRRDDAIERRAGAQRDLHSAGEAEKSRREAEAPIAGLTAAADSAKDAHSAAMDDLPNAAIRRAEADAIDDPPAIDLPQTVEPDAAAISRADALDAEAALIIDPPAPVRPPLAILDPEAAVRANALDEDAKTLTATADTTRIPDLITTTAEESKLATAREAYDNACRSPWRSVEEYANDIDDKLVGSGPWAVSVKVETDVLRECARANGGDIESIRKTFEDAEAALAAAKANSESSAQSIQAVRTQIAQLRSAAQTKRDEATAIRRKAIDDCAAANRKIEDDYNATRSEWTKRCNDLEGQRRGLRQIAADTRNAALAAAKKSNDDARRQYDRDVATRNALITANQNERYRLRAEADRIERTARSAQEAADKARTDLEAAQARLDGIQSVAVDVATAHTVVEDADRSIAEIDLTIKAAQAADARKREMDELLVLIDRATALRDCYAAAEWALARCREEDVRARSSGLEERVSKFLRAAGRSEVPYLRVQRSVTEFGWRRGSKEISVAVLSGGEFVLFCAGLAAAIVAMRGPSIRTLLIEAAELGAADPAQAVLRGCAAVAEDLDVIIVATNAGIAAPAEWNVITCAAREEVAV